MSNESTLCPFTAKYEATLFPLIYSIVFCIGFLGNVAAAGVIIHHIKGKNVLGIYLANLCVSDLLYVFTLPIWIIYTAREDWQFGALSCKILGFFFNANIYTTMAFLSCIAMDRFLATVFPLQSRTLRSMKAAALVCIIIWLIILGSHSVFLSQDELFNASRDVELCYEKYPMDQWMAHINYFRIFVVFLVPFVLLVFSYCCIIVVIHRSPSLEKEQKRKITSLLLAMTIIFIICYFPYHVTLFIRSYISDRNTSSCQIEMNIRPAYRISFALTSLSSALDPFINVFVSNGVKQEITEEMRAFWLWCTGRSHQTTKQNLCNQKLMVSSDKDLLKIQTRF
uniref:G-protein coupled receptor 4-like n=1 Tax=Geotrypetes seraphini TaxID=260995 RepID=A0A6P8S595_GEOSA|nr:G-protein coupled receptor 4-like [Geotrypetes seraphini]XP_033812002.1 G-protein coupled receptor 4-like [Geotrypetes seraphini]